MSDTFRSDHLSVRLRPPHRCAVEEHARRERRSLSNTIGVIVAAALDVAKDTAPEASQ